MWLTKIKIAIVEKNSEKINLLLEEVPKFESTQDIEEAMYLLKEATQLISTLKDDTKQSMIQLKKNINFLKSTQAPSANKLDIKS
ncbi:MAG: hypothetical protein QM497_01305 [Sulfurimonas sp.]